MPVPEDVRHALSRWCADRLPEPERARRRIGYTVHGAEVVITDRRAPAYPELDASWSSTPLARLRRRDDGTWALQRPAPGGAWADAGSGPDPVGLLDAVTV